MAHNKPFNNQVQFLDGQGVKNITLPQYPDSAWDWITGKPDGDGDKATNLYSRVAAVFRVANLTADAIANLPFALVNKAGDTVDDSEDWQNVCGFMNQPKDLLRLWRLSMFMTNSAYGFLEKKRSQPRAPLQSDLRFLVPTTITPQVDKSEGLIGFKRRLGSETTFYKRIDDGGPIFWMFWMDHTTELLPSEHTEFKALMAAAGVLFYSDYYVENFFQRGGIKPHLLFVKGSPTKEDREQIESVWTKIISGSYKFLGKVFNSETMDVTPVGDGIENISKTELHADKLEDIAIAAGMPLSLILASSANYATAKIEKLTWLSDTIIPKAKWMAEEINRKLFTGTDFKFEFRYEQKSEMQEEERERALAYRLYVNAGILPSVAAQVVGMDLPPEIEYEDLDAMQVAQDQRHAELEKMQRAGRGDADEDLQVPEKDPEMTKSIAPEPAPELTLDQMNELNLWRQIAFRKFKRGEGLDFPFVEKALDSTTASVIRDRLVRSRTHDDIKAAFDVSRTETNQADLMALAEALNRASEVMTQPELVTQGD